MFSFDTVYTNVITELPISQSQKSQNLLRNEETFSTNSESALFLLPFGAITNAVDLIKLQILYYDWSFPSQLQLYVITFLKQCLLYFNTE